MTINADAQASHGELVNAIRVAMHSAVNKLFRSHPDHHFYYCALLTTGEALAPTLTAWSTEALDAITAANPEDTTARSDLKWSPVDSPFYCYGEEYFGDVRRVFSELPPIVLMDAAAWQQASAFRISAMEQAVKELDQEGLFGEGATRARIVVNVEVLPPDRTNTERALRLNPPDALAEWIEEAAET